MNINKPLQLIACVSSAIALGGVATVSNAQQSMKVSDGGMSNGKLIKLGDCVGLIVPPTSRAASPANKVADKKAVPQTTPVANAVWQVVAPGVINYCVRAGVANSGAAPSGAPWQLAMQDQRTKNDPGYADEHGKANKPIPAIHPAAPARQATGAAPVAAASVSALPDTWCVTNLGWEKRPRLALTLTIPSTASGTQTISCQVDVKDEKKLAPNANILTALGGSAVVIDASTAPRTPPLTSLPAKKIDPPKEPEGMKKLGNGKIGQAN